MFVLPSKRVQRPMLHEQLEAEEQASMTPRARLKP